MKTPSNSRGFGPTDPQSKRGVGMFGAGPAPAQPLQMGYACRQMAHQRCWRQPRQTAMSCNEDAALDVCTVGLVHGRCDLRRCLAGTAKEPEDTGVHSKVVSAGLELD